MGSQVWLDFKQGSSLEFNSSPNRLASEADVADLSSMYSDQLIIFVTWLQAFLNRSHSSPSSWSGTRWKSAVACGSEESASSALATSRTSYFVASFSSTSLRSTTSRWRWSAPRHGSSTAFSVPFHSTPLSIDSCLSFCGDRRQTLLSVGARSSGRHANCAAVNFIFSGAHH